MAAISLGGRSSNKGTPDGDIHIERRQIPDIIKELQEWAISMGSANADHAILSLPTEEGQVPLVYSCYCNKAAPKRTGG